MYTRCTRVPVVVRTLFGNDETRRVLQQRQHYWVLTLTVYRNCAHHRWPAGETPDRLENSSLRANRPRNQAPHCYSCASILYFPRDGIIVERVCACVRARVLCVCMCVSWNYCKMIRLHGIIEKISKKFGRNIKFQKILFKYPIILLFTLGTNWILSKSITKFSQL